MLLLGGRRVSRGSAAVGAETWASSTLFQGRDNCDGTGRRVLPRATAPVPGVEDEPNRVVVQFHRVRDGVGRLGASRRPSSSDPSDREKGLRHGFEWTTAVLVGQPRNVPIRSLRLDPYNPRLPESFRGGSQEDLAVVLEMGFEAFAVAQSVADNGYFMGEPLSSSSRKTRRTRGSSSRGIGGLTALLGLTDPEIRGQFAEPDRWEGVGAKDRPSRSTT